MARVDEAARRFVAQVEAGGAEALARVADELARVLPALVEQARGAAEGLAALRAAGGVPSDLQLYAVIRARAVASQVEAELRRILAMLTPSLANGQLAAIQTGLDAARELVALSLPASVNIEAAWTSVPFAAVVQQIAAGVGPLGQLLDAIGTDAGQRVRMRLTQGMLAGKNPRTVAKVIAEEGALGQARAETVARTEMLRAYRESSRMAYQQNPDVVTGYRRMAAHSGRTCVMCLALDGKRQDTDELMAVHPNDRCAVVPIVDYHRFGLKAPAPAQTGAEWFRKQPPDVQRRILGPGGYQAYQQGTALTDFVSVHHSPDWGPTLRRRPLSEVA